MLWKVTQRTFNGGQLDARLMGRTDLAKYYESASVLENFLVKRQGCIVKRRGTLQIADVTTATGCTEISDYRLFPFSFDKDKGYIVALFFDQNLGTKCFVFDKNGAIKSTLNGLPYQGEDFNQISFDQSGDVLFLAHCGYPFAQIVRYTDVDWRYEVVDFATCGNSSIPETPTIASVAPSEGFPETGVEKVAYYYATAVINGIESAPSSAGIFSYHAPWPEGGSAVVTIQQQTPAPDYYNIYKKDISYVGLIGTTSRGISAGDKVVTTRPNVSENSDRFAYNSKYDDIRSNPSVSREVDDAYSFGYVYERGVCTLTYDTAIDISSVSIALGYVWCGITDSRTNNRYLQYLPCNCDSIEAEVTYSDEYTGSIGNQQVPNNVKSTTTEIIYLRSVTDVEEKRREMSNKAIMTWSVPGRPGAKVKSVKFTAYSTGTTVANGSISDMTRTSPYGFATITGNPFTISGYWAKIAVKGGRVFADEYITPDASLTPPKYGRFFDTVGKYPGCVSVYQQRLALAKSMDQPFTFWMSRIGDIYNFNVHDSIREDDALEVTLPATKYPNINHMITNRDLIMFCDSGEWIVSPASGSAMTYKTVSTKIQSQIGCSCAIKPLAVNDDVIFANLTAETLIATKYSYATDGYESTDLSVLTQDIFRGNPITSLAYKQHPDSIIVATLEDGTFATLEYMKEHEVVAWSHHWLGGGLKARYCCADGSVTSGTTDVYILAEDESVVGSRQYYLLRVKEDSDLNTVSNAVSMDQMREVNVSSPTPVPDGFVAVNTRTGRVAYSEEEDSMTTGRWIIGRIFGAILVSVKPEPSQNETVQFEIKNPTEVEIRIHEGSSFRVGQYGLSGNKYRYVRINPECVDGTIQLATEDKSTLIAGANNRDGRIRLTSNEVWPLTILSISTTYQIEKANQEPQNVKGGGDAD